MLTILVIIKKYNENHNEVSLHKHKNGLRKMTKSNSSEDAEQLELWYIANGNENWNSHFGKFSVSYKVNYSYHRTQQSDFWVFTQE